MGHFVAQAKVANRLIFNKKRLFNAKNCPIFFSFQDWGSVDNWSFAPWRLSG